MLSVPGPASGNRERGCALLRSLYGREINGTKTRLNVVRATYQTVYPNFSIIDVSRPTEFLRKFTPDGRHLITFSNDLTSVLVYNYLGCSMAIDLLKNNGDDHIENEDDEERDIARSQIFERLFQLKYSVPVSSVGETLIKSCNLFTKDGRHVLVVSSRVHRISRRDSIFRPDNSEFLNPILLFPLEDYTLYLIDLSHGRVSDTLCFKVDKIYFNYNFGIYLFDDTLTVLSIFHQTIHVYKIIHDRFYLLRRIGKFCYEDDYNLTTLAPPFTTYVPGMKIKFNRQINGLKHKFMVSLYKKAAQENRMRISKNSLRTFYTNFNQVNYYFMIMLIKLLL